MAEFFIRQKQYNLNFVNIHWIIMEVNIMSMDVLAPCVARTTATMVLNTPNIHIQGHLYRLCTFFD